MSPEEEYVVMDLALRSYEPGVTKKELEKLSKEQLKLLSRILIEGVKKATEK